MPSVICVHFQSTCTLLCDININFIRLLSISHAKILESALERQVS